MIASYEVGSIFRVVDEATPVLERIARLGRDVAVSIKGATTELRAMGRVTLSGVTRGAKEASDAILRIGAASEEARASTVQSMESINAGKMMAARNARELALAMGEVAGMSRAVAIANAGSTLGGRRGGPHGPGRGLHVSSLSANVPGGHIGFRGGGNAALLGAGALAYGVYEEAQFEDAAFRAMYTAGVPTDKMSQQTQYKGLRDLIQQGSATTGAPIHDVEEAVLTGIRQFAGMPWADRMKIMPQLLLGAAGEARLKGHGTTLDQGMEAFTGLAHMTQHYTPEQVAELIPKFAYLSATSRRCA